MGKFLNISGIIAKAIEIVVLTSAVEIRKYTKNRACNYDKCFTQFQRLT
ncbi:MAG: hypothetical protein ACW99F_19845 [Candidatus Hodarchaeales archaeon]